MNSVLKLLQQPSGVIGVSVVLGTLVSASTHQITWQQAIPVLAGAMLAIVVPDNTTANADGRKLAVDLLAGNSAAAAADGAALAKDVGGKT